MPTKASYEFSSFRSSLDAAHNSPRSTPSYKATPWVPGGVGKKHIHTKGLPSAKEREFQAVSAVKDQHAKERESLHGRLDATTAAFDRFDARFDKVASQIEEHMIGASAAGVLVQKRLEQLGLL